MNINNRIDKRNFTSLSPLSAPLGKFYNANAVLPTLFIETGVTLGRAWEANKRGGKLEATDRLVEQGVSAVVWLWGVDFLKNIGNFLGKHLLKISDFDFDIGFDELRNPTKYADKKSLGFKAGNILVSTILATYFIGAVLPKINNKILKNILKQEKESKQNKNDSLNPLSFNEFQNKTKNNISFTSLLDKTVNMAHILENNASARLFITDAGVVSGRFCNAKNKYRKIEGLFRDISSIYFYLRFGKDFAALLNKITKTPDINPQTLEKTIELLNQKLKENPNLSVSEFKKLALGTIDEGDFAKLKELFSSKKIVSYNDFCNYFPSLSQKAKDMANLQYGDELILSFQEAKDVLSSGWVSSPSFLKDTYNRTYNKDVSDKLSFVSSKNLDKTRKSIDDFILRMCDLGDKKGTSLNEEFINKFAKNNISKNFIFRASATILCAFVLGILIPKVQYAISKKLSHEDKFHIDEE